MHHYQDFFAVVLRNQKSDLTDQILEKNVLIAGRYFEGFSVSSGNADREVSLKKSLMTLGLNETCKLCFQLKKLCSEKRKS